MIITQIIWFCNHEVSHMFYIKTPASNPRTKLLALFIHLFVAGISLHITLPEITDITDSNDFSRGSVENSPAHD